MLKQRQQKYMKNDFNILAIELIIKILAEIQKAYGNVKLTIHFKA
jgi:hypothetical protein